jgi:hypothetical protein
MWLKGLVTVLLFLAGPMITGVSAEEGTTPVEDSTATVDTAQQVAPLPDRIVVTYFHGDKRCGTCHKLEAYSREAIEQGFGQDLIAGTIEWRTVNYDEADNEHYIDDYKLFSKAVILSRMEDGQEVEWKNLDQIWALVGDKDKFVQYVKSETTAFVNGEETE